MCMLCLVCRWINADLEWLYHGLTFCENLRYIHNTANSKKSKTPVMELDISAMCTGLTEEQFKEVYDTIFSLTPESFSEAECMQLMEAYMTTGFKKFEFTEKHWGSPKPDLATLVFNCHRSHVEDLYAWGPLHARAMEEL